MIVEMIKTSQGSRNGIIVETFQKDKEYDLPKHLIDTFLSFGWCKLLDDEEETKKEPEKDVIEEEKAIEVPNNKAVKVPENKTTTKKGK